MRRLEQRLADDPAGAFGDLVRVYQDRLFAFAFRLTGSRQDAEEVVQDALVRAYRALSGYGSERVRTLRIYCFPTCHRARRIARRHRVEFRGERQAAAAGYRPCRVCRPSSAR